MSSVMPAHAPHLHSGVGSAAHREVVELALGLPRHLLHPCSERRIVTEDQQPPPRLLILVHHILHVQLQGGTMLLDQLKSSTLVVAHNIPHVQLQGDATLIWLSEPAA